MLKRLLFSTAVVAVLSVSADAGTWFTQYATIEGGTTADTTFVNLITGQSSVGRTYTNTIDTAAPSQAPGATARVVVVGANLLADTYSRSVGAPPFSTASLYSGDPVVGVFALEGTSVGLGGGAFVLTVDTGRLGFFTQTSGGFAANGPATWGATNAAGTVLNTPIAVFDLVPPEAVTGGVVDGVPDPTGIFNLAAGQVNRSSINVAEPDNLQGNFLFEESTTFGDPPAQLEGTNFVRVTGPGVTPPNVPTGVEGLVTRSDQSLDLATGLLNDLGFPGGPPVTVPPTAPSTLGAGFAALNTIAVSLGGLGGNAAGGFATAYAGTGYSTTNTGVATDFNILIGDVLTTGDLRASLGTTSAPVAQGAIPEPASVAVWAVIVGVGGVGMRRRRSKKA